MAGDNERFSRHSPLWRKVSSSIGSFETTDDVSKKLTLDSLYKTFFRSRNEIRKVGYYEQALHAFAAADSGKLQHLIHETQGNQLVLILNEASKLAAQPKEAIQSVIHQHVEKLFRSIEAQARVDPGRYLRTKERLDMARENVPAIAEHLANQLLEAPHGRWRKPRASKPDLGESLLLLR